MRRVLALAVGLSLAAAVGGARAQNCLSYSDGLGGTTISCPDGRTGYVHDDGAGGAAGMIGSQPFAGSSASLSPPFGPQSGAPSAAFIAPPLPPPYSPPPPDAGTAAPPPPLASQTGLTPLQQQYLDRQPARDRFNPAEAPARSRRRGGYAPPA
ncbi:MAG TPA: hypothetical protein VL358_13700 [Caulobacteraceae bacterium]|jgi:hypothetical protein|nr:hypothetical protein [Caulobacteraceae bacterium]